MYASSIHGLGMGELYFQYVCISKHSGKVHFMAALFTQPINEPSNFGW